MTRVGEIVELSDARYPIGSDDPEGEPSKCTLPADEAGPAPARKPVARARVPPAGRTVGPDRDAGAAGAVRAGRDAAGASGAARRACVRWRRHPGGRARALRRADEHTNASAFTSRPQGSRAEGAELAGISGLEARESGGDRGVTEAISIIELM